MLFFSLSLESRQVKHTLFSSLVTRPVSAQVFSHSLVLLWIPSSVLTNPSSLHSKLLLNFSLITSHSISSRSAFYSASAHTSSWLWERDHRGSSAELLRRGQPDWCWAFLKSILMLSWGWQDSLLFFEKECPFLISKSYQSWLKTYKIQICQCTGDSWAIHKLQRISVTILCFLSLLSIHRFNCVLRTFFCVISRVSLPASHVAE